MTAPGTFTPDLGPGALPDRHLGRAITKLASQATGPAAVFLTDLGHAIATTDSRADASHLDPAGRAQVGRILAAAHEQARADGTALRNEMLRIRAQWETHDRAANR